MILTGLSELRNWSLAVAPQVKFRYRCGSRTEVYPEMLLVWRSLTVWLAVGEAGYWCKVVCRPLRQDSFEVFFGSGIGLFGGPVSGGYI